MYSRFLKEASKIVSNEELDRIGDILKDCGDMWEEMAFPLKEALDIENPALLIKDIPDKLNVIAEREEQVFNRLKKVVM
jgi:hypothetical protein